MKCVIPEISWHNREPVLCVDVHPINRESHYRIATGGADYHILIWTGIVDEKGGINVQVAADLTRHQKAVNALRWSPDGTMLASADDDAVIFLWTRKTDIQEAKGYKEYYTIHKILRGHKEDIYDLCWSPRGDKIITGSIDNSAILWDVVKGKCEYIFSDHKGFVQGVCWDPKGKYIATLSSDRHCRIIDAATKQVKSRILKGLLPVPASHPFYDKEVKYFHDDTFKSYYRRFGFSPDGNLFITPAGFVETDDNKTMKCAYVFTLDNLQPIGIFPFDHYCTLVAKFSPVLYELSSVGPEPYINLPYRMVFAIAAETDIFFYDTQQQWPFGRLKNIHYTRITDLSWSSDGKLLVAASSDGYCTLLSFVQGEIGEVYVKEDMEDEKENSALNVSEFEEVEPIEIEEIRETSDKELASKRSTFLLQWAHKAREGVKVMNDIAKVNISEEKINALKAKEAPQTGDMAQDKEEQIAQTPTKTKKRKSTTLTRQKLVTSDAEASKAIGPIDGIPEPCDEVIEIGDSPIKQDSEILSLKPKRIIVNAGGDSNLQRQLDDVKARTLGAKPIAIRRKPREDTTSSKKEKQPKPNPLLKFLNVSPEKKIKPVEEDTEARDSWKCEDKASTITTESPKCETTDDITVPDLDLKLENSTQSKAAPVVVVSDESNDSLITSLKLHHTPKLGNSSHSKLTETTELTQREKKMPRRVSLITLSSPKHKKQKHL